MKRLYSWTLLMALFSIVIAGCSPSPVDFQGTVVDSTGQRLAGLQVSLAGETVAVNDDGAFKLKDVPGGKHPLVVSRGGKEIHREGVFVHKDHAGLTVYLGQISQWIPVVGEWKESSKDGTFLITNSDGETGTTNAYAEIEQIGKRIIYEWSVEYHDGGSAGMHMMARSGADSANHGGSYLLFHSAANYLRLYRTTESKLDGSKISPIVEKDDVSVHDYRVEINTETGEIEVYYNDRYIRSWTDPEPYKMGEFIALRTSGTKATFSNVKVTIED